MKIVAPAKKQRFSSTARRRIDRPTATH
jgi:hypothetical protein